MNFHVETRRISDRDWMWAVRGWTGETMEFGHEKFKKDAASAGRAAKRFLLAQYKKIGNNGHQKKKKR
jgi:hypothetical protein